MAVLRIVTLLFLIGALFALVVLLAMMDERAASASFSGDRDALVALYNATGGDNWADNANWLSEDAPLGEWHGVTTDGEDRVVALKLSKNGLNGELPAQLSDLSALRELRLAQNGLSGEIRDDLSRLANLEALSLAGNSLSGEIPEELGDLTNLEHLLLNGNQLEGQIPAALSNIANLERLHLRNNQFTGCIPEGLQDVPNNDLSGLDLPVCDSAPPPTATPTPTPTPTATPTHTTNPGSPDRDVLVILYNATGGDNWTGSANWKTSAPLGEWHGVTTDAEGRVTHLNLSRNGLNGDPPSELGNLSNLQELKLTGNQLSGEIPATWGNLSSLRDLRLAQNQLYGGIPSALGDLTGLETLILAGNQLSEEIPEEMGRLANLTRLALNGNQLSGDIPPELSDLSNLERLQLRNNQFTGCIPDGLQDVATNDLSEIDLPVCVLPQETLTDRDILVTLYNATGGDYWFDNTNWLSDAPLDEWYGVTAGDDGRVIGLELFANGLGGRIPPELGSLANLTALILAGSLRGPIPPELGSLANLEELILSGGTINGNGLSGPIPPELGNLANLTGLILRENLLSGPIPPELGNLANLTELSLAHNLLTGGIPPELGDLANLEGLFLIDNQLSGPIPRELGSLANLVQLDLPHNRLTGPIPPELGSLTELDLLSLQSNRLTGDIPAELGNLTNLNMMHLSGNELTGCIPAAWSTVPHNDFDESGLPFCNSPGSAPPADEEVTDRDALVALYEATDGDNWTDNTNWLTDAPLGEWYGVTATADGRVIQLILDANGLEGQLPPELSSLANLAMLFLDGNDLSGPIPSQLGNRTNLEHLSLVNNQLSGPIPPQLGNQTRLEYLSLANNQLSGPIPSQLGNLTNLEFLSLADNQLSGPIPPRLGNLTSLGYLSLRHNQLSGRIPPQLSSLDSLVKLALNNNLLEGPMPPELGDFASLMSMHLANNRLDGPIPPELGNSPYLAVLSLNDNLLTGDIPGELENLTNVYWAYLSGNELTGCVPAEWRDVEYNDFRTLGLPFCDSSPDWGALVALYNATDGDNWENNTNWLSSKPIGEWRGVSTNDEGRVTRLTLGSNGLAGPIPPELGNLADLISLWLEDNQLSGPIPPELGNPANLEELRLANNQLSGPIPPELGNLASLISLWLEDNQLTGPIPPELGNFANLERLVLYGNQLTGQIPLEMRGLVRLQHLLLMNNRLTGDIPPELGEVGSLTHLIGVYLRGNELTGCIPVEWQDVLLHDFHVLGLLLCGAAVPLAPTGLTSATDGPTAIVLSWTAPAPEAGTRAAVSGYRIQWSAEGGDDSWAELATTDAVTTTYRHAGLSAATTVHYRVIATSQAGDSAPSAVTSAMSACSTTTSDAGSVTLLGWNFDNVGASGADVAASAGHEALNCASLRRVGLTAPPAGDFDIYLGDLGFNWTDELLDDAFHSFGWPRPSETGDGSYLEFSVARPAGSDATVSLESVKAFVFFVMHRDYGQPQWRLRSSHDGYATDIDGVKIARLEDDPDREGVVHVWNPVAFDISGLPDLTAENGAYTFRLYGSHGIHNVGEVEYDHGMSVTKRQLRPHAGQRVHPEASADQFDLKVTGQVTGELPQSAPVGLTATGRGPAAIALSWAAPAPDTARQRVTGYLVEVSPDGIGSWEELASTGASTTAYRHTGLGADTTWYYRVIATGPDADSAPSATASATTVNEAPRFQGASATRSVTENTPPGVAIGAPVSAADPDARDVLTYSLGGADAAAFAIDATSGQLRTNAPLDYETRDSYAVTVTATDGHGASAVVPVSITVADLNEAPAFAESDPAARQVAENTPSGVAIGAPVAASDPDAGDALTYSLGGADAAAFAIDADTGQLRTSAPLDYETRSSYAVTVSVTDGRLTDTITVDITVTDVAEAPPPDNDPPTANAGPDFAVDEDAREIRLDGRRSSDPDQADRSQLTYRWTAPEGITLHNAGRLRPAFAALQVSEDAGYVFTLRVTDPQGAFAEDTVTVTVRDVPEGSPRPNLAASDLTRTGATLTLSNHSGDWWYRVLGGGDGICQKAGGSEVALSALEPGTEHTVKAYSQRGCSVRIASISFETEP